MKIGENCPKTVIPMKIHIQIQEDQTYWNLIF